MQRPRILFVFLNFILFGTALAQEHGFPFANTITLKELAKTKYELDSAANAIVINEFGEAYFDNETGRLVVNIHKLIKILTKEGLEQGNFEIGLRIGDKSQDELVTIKGVTHFLKEGSKKMAELNRKSIFREKNPTYELVKFSMPNVEVGSIVEVMYTISTPFILNFWPWEFQSDIPKLYSEYWAQIPAKYDYNISLRGALKLDKKEDQLVQECLRVGGGVSDCSLIKFGMKNIPAFKEEKYMTAKSNFLSAINFELSEVRYFDGRIDKLTKEWKDVAEELFESQSFGAQIRKSKNLFEDNLSSIISSATDPLLKAKSIYYWILSRYEWNERFGEYTDKGVKVAFEDKKGNVADINLSLLGALQAAGLTAHPVIISTRRNGLLTSLYPVLTEFNYVIVMVKIGEESFLLDATDPLIPFGMLPMRCLNGTGRLLMKKEAPEINLMPKSKSRTVSTLNLKLTDAGDLIGTLQIKYHGYDAIDKRREIKSFADIAAYTKSISDRWKVRQIRNHKVDDLSDLEKPFTEEMEIEFNPHDASGADRIYLNPFIMGWNVNPFKSRERKYPVDFGVAQEEIILLNLEYPAGYKLDEIPKNMALALPNKGGMFKFNFNDLANKINIYYSLNLTKPVYDATEYLSLKDLFERMLQLKQTDLVFIKL
ncbi:MAG: DUF3857 domain-containing protein [Cyclobacteriaceae bacterium]|nr:DUF3857 domain-containing protein [Cyclobacteriaceae bacterium]